MTFEADHYNCKVCKINLWVVKFHDMYDIQLGADDFQLN